MMERLRKRYFQSGQALLNIIEHKIKTLEIKNNEYIAYLNELYSLYEQHDLESENLNITLMSDETKILYAASELKKIGFQTHLFYKIKIFQELINELGKIHEFDEKINNLKNIDRNNNSENNNELNINYVKNFKNKNKNDENKISINNNKTNNKNNNIINNNNKLY